MKKVKIVLYILVIFFCSMGIVNAQSNMEYIWKSDGISNLYSEELLKIDDGLFNWRL